MANGKPLISLIIPVFNEDDNILPMYETLQSILQGLSDRFDFELVFTDNRCAPDKTAGGCFGRLQRPTSVSGLIASPATSAISVPS